MNRDTVSIHFVRAATRSLSRSATRRVLETAGIPENLVGVRAARVPAASFGALWLAVARELDDEFFGLDSRRMKVGSFALLCRAALPARDLEHALHRCLKAFAAFLDDIDAALSRDGRDAVITVTNRIVQPAARRFAEETYLVMVHGLMCWLTARRIPLSQAAFVFAKPAHSDEYRRMFTQALAFGAERTAIRFDAAQLAAPVVQSEAALRQFLRSAPQSVFVKYRNENSWTARLRRRLRGSTGASWPTLEQMAAEFHVASSTLRRRLEDEGTTYRLVKDALRRDAAIHRLCESSDSIAEIAAALGFQDASTFHRAFKKWTGVRPGAYRSRQDARLRVSLLRTSDCAP